MAYDLQTIRNRVLVDKLDDTTFSAAIVDNFINDTQRDIFASYELPFMEKTFAGALAPGERIFTFPTDYQIAVGLVITDPTGYERNITNNYMPYREFNQAYPTPGNNSAGAPLNWTLFAGNLYLDKPTDQTYTLQLYYIKTPATLTNDTDVPEVPEVFQEVLVLGAYYRCHEHNEDYDLADNIEQKYNTALATLGVRLANRQTGTGGAMAQPNRIASSRSRGRA